MRCAAAAPAGSVVNTPAVGVRLCATSIGVALFAVACSAPSSDRPGAPATAATSSADDELSWSKCADSPQFECAVLDVPWSYEEPTGASLALAVIRQAARKPARRTGVVIVNPGGPGGSGIDSFPQLVHDLGPLIGDRLDIVSFDPRGVGRSARFECLAPGEREFTIDVTPDNDAEIAALLQTVRDQNTRCAAQDPHFSQFGSRNVARDIDRLRARLGEDTISFVGYSYGTRIGVAYADLFPDRLRALVLDGSVPPGTRQGDPRRGQAAAFASAFARWSDWCTTRPKMCSISGDPLEAYERVVAAAEDAPIPVAGSAGVQGWIVELAAAGAMYTRNLWPALARGLASGAAGDGARLADLMRTLFPRDAEDHLTNTELATAVQCADEAWRPSDGEIQAAAAEVNAAVTPNFAFTWMALASCAGLGPPAEPIEDLGVLDVVPVLVVANTGDPATPYEWGEQMVAVFERAVVLTLEADRHTAGGGSACVNDALATYLLELRSPRQGTRCR